MTGSPGKRRTWAPTNSTRRFRTTGPGHGRPHKRISSGPMNAPFRLGFLCLALVTAIATARAGVNNLKVVTDASPDYTDLESLVQSVTGKWNTPEEKCWAMFYWNHVARRQTNPIILHGFALTDPIRQFNDYGYTMCSTISGINCSIW